jgi:hypothetical protein
MRNKTGGVYVGWTLGKDPMQEHRKKKLIPIIHDNINDFTCKILAETQKLYVAEQLEKSYRKLYKHNIDE